MVTYEASFSPLSPLEQDQFTQLVETEILAEEATMATIVANGLHGVIGRVSAEAAAQRELLATGVQDVNGGVMGFQSSI